ncbi:MAG: hypothetical protein ACFFCS_29185 [Candidatus Hodarchaeota archaeon]
MTEKIIFARAPVRICDVGGWTDTWFYEGTGAVFNFCVDLYSYVRVVSKAEKNNIKIISENLDLSTEIEEFRKIEYDGTLDLLKAAVKRMDIREGMQIFARADAPPGCGTGTSASIAVAMIGALSLLKGEYYVPHQIAQLAHSLETEELHLQSGVQDQYASAFGGFNYMEIDYPDVKISQIKVKPQVIWQLEQQLVLVYLASRSSSKMHEAVIENYEKGDPKSLEAFANLKKCPELIIQALHKGDMQRFGEIMYQNWSAQKDLHPLMTNPRIEQLERICESCNALGLKINGAGGGGSAVILSSVGNEYKLKKELITKGFEILPCKVNLTGVQAWQH